MAAMQVDPDHQNGEEEEELEDLPQADKQADPYFQQKIKRVVDGVTFTGQVEDIEVGKVSRERLYRIRYEDGDLEHLTEKDVKEGRQLDEAATPEASSPAKGKRKAREVAAPAQEEAAEDEEEEEEDEEDEEEEEDEPAAKKKPAAAGGRGAAKETQKKPAAPKAPVKAKKAPAKAMKAPAKPAKPAMKAPAAKAKAVMKKPAKR